MRKIFWFEKNFFLGLLGFFAALILQIKFNPLFGLKINFVLMALVVLALFLDFFEVIFLELLGVFVLNWQPNLSTETIIFFLLPAIISLIKKFLPGQLWFNGLLLIVLGVLGFYYISSLGSFLKNWPEAFGGIITTIGFGFMIFFSFYSIQDYN